MARLNGSQLDNEFKIDEAGDVPAKAARSKRCGLIIVGKFHVNLCLFRKFRKRRDLNYGELRGRFERNRESDRVGAKK